VTIPHLPVRRTLAVLWCCSIPFRAAAQQPAPTRPDSGPVPTAPDSGAFKVTPLFAPAYNPEMQFLIVGGVLLSWKVGPNPVKLQRSTLSSTVSLSTTGAVNFATTLNSFWYGDRLRINADFGIKRMPDNYWGVGYDAALEPSSGDATTEYDREWFKFSPRIVWGVSHHLFVGGVLDINRTIATDVNATMTMDPAYQQYGSVTANSGLGLAVQYDSRDVAVNAWRGLYLGLTATFYGRRLGGDHEYQIFLLDYRQYRALGRPGRTLAWQVKARIGAHDVPWPELSMLGTAYDLRGYVEGRFRDRATLLGLVEYRHMFLRGDGRGSRHGVVAWVGGGTLGNDIAHLTGFLPNGGVGYRFELHPRSNVRADVGVGYRSSGVYFSFTEAF
jgi:hypothetical protein